MKKIAILFAFLLTQELCADFEKITYRFTTHPIDAVIPCHSKDAQKLDLVIEGIKKNVRNIRNIYVVSNVCLTNNAFWISEKMFPFDQMEIALEMFHGDENQARAFVERPKTRINWIYQQFLKLYAPYIIPGISQNVLIVDGDTIFLNPVSFQDASGAPLFNPGIEHNPAYFDHAARVLPGFRKVFPQHSGITHHMLFQKCILDDLFDHIQRANGIEPWRALARNINPTDFAGISEYELYFNFAFLRSNQGKIRPLKWFNTIENYVIDQRGAYRAQGYAYISCHTYCENV